MCLPMTDLHLGARNDSYNIRRTLTPLRALRNAGVNVCLVTNNVRNAFTPFGSGDLLHVGLVAIPACHLGGADDQKTVLDMLTTNPVCALGLCNYGIKVDNQADSVLVNSKVVDAVVMDQPQRLFVVKKDKIVFKSNRQI